MSGINHTPVYQVNLSCVFTKGTKARIFYQVSVFSPSPMLPERELPTKLSSPGGGVSTHGQFGQSGVTNRQLLDR